MQIIGKYVKFACLLFHFAQTTLAIRKVVEVVWAILHYMFYKLIIFYFYGFHSASGGSRTLMRGRFTVPDAS